MSAAVVSRLLRAPSEVAASCREGRDIRPIVAVSLGAIVVGSAVFGGVLGSFRGGAQIAYAAIKIPLAIVATLAVCAPAFHAFTAAFGKPWPMRSIVSLVVAAAGRSALVLLAFAPALWLVLDWGIGYHAAALAASLAYMVAGLAALGILVRGLRSSDTPSGPLVASNARNADATGGWAGGALLTLSFLGIFFAVGGQTAWILRPYLVRPRTEHVPFLRSREGGFSDALLTSGRSAAGIYDVTRQVQEEPFTPPARRKAPIESTPDQESNDTDDGASR